MSKRILPVECCGAIIDLQEFFLSQVNQRVCSKIVTNTTSFVRLLSYLRIPIIVTLEQPLDRKGSLPKEISEHLHDLAYTFEKEFFDLTKEERIREHLAGLGKKQVIAAGWINEIGV